MCQISPYLFSNISSNWQQRIFSCQQSISFILQDPYFFAVVFFYMTQYNLYFFSCKSQLCQKDIALATSDKGDNGTYYLLLKHRSSWWPKLKPGTWMEHSKQFDNPFANCSQSMYLLNMDKQQSLRRWCSAKNCHVSLTLIDNEITSD